MTHPVLTPTCPTKAAHRSPWHRMPFRLSSTSSRGMRLRSSSFSIVNRGQSLECEQQAPQELQASIGRHAWDLCGVILSTERAVTLEPSRRNCRFRTVMRILELLVIFETSLKLMIDYRDQLAKALRG